MDEKLCKCIIYYALAMLIYAICYALEECFCTDKSFQLRETSEIWVHFPQFHSETYFLVADLLHYLPWVSNWSCGSRSQGIVIFDHPRSPQVNLQTAPKMFVKSFSSLNISHKRVLANLTVSLFMATTLAYSRRSWSILVVFCLVRNFSLSSCFRRSATL